MSSSGNPYVAASVNASSPGDRLAARQLVEQAHAALERLSEPLLLGANDALDLGLAIAELRIRVAHLPDDDGRQPVDVAQPDAPRLQHRTPDDPPQDVPATLVRGRHAVADEERHPAAVVGEDAVRLRRLRRVAVRDTGLGRDPVHDVPEPVGLVDGRDVLEDSGRPLESHSRVDVLRREGRQRAVRLLLELHEDEVPELEETFAACAAGCAVRVPTAGRLAPVPEDLRVGPAGPWAADRPEVLGARKRHDPLGGHPDLLPELDRDLVRAELQLRIAGVHGHPDAIPVELHPLAYELGRELDRTLLVVLPEREVAEHLEEGQVVRVEADVVDVRRPEHLLDSSSSGARADPRVRGSTASAAACRRSSGASSGRPRAGPTTRTARAGGPSPRRRRGTLRAAQGVVRITRFYERAESPPRGRLGGRWAACSRSSFDRPRGALRRARSRGARPLPWRP